MRLVWINQPPCQDPVLVGSKAALLGRLTAELSFVNIPPGFCVTDTAFAQGIWDLEIGDEILAAYARLADVCRNPRLPVAIRASFLHETEPAIRTDPPTAILGVFGAQAVRDGIVTCWESARRSEAGATASAIAVLVQQMLTPEAAVTGLSTAPEAPDSGEMVIRANWGFHARGGTLDRYRVRKADLRITDREIADKTRMTIRDGAGLIETENTDEQRSYPALDNLEIVEFARILRDIEAHLEKPVEVECGVQDGRVCVLRCRLLAVSAAAHDGADFAEGVVWQTRDDEQREWHLYPAEVALPFLPLPESLLPYQIRASQSGGDLRYRFIHGYLYVAGPAPTFSFPPLPGAEENEAIDGLSDDEIFRRLQQSLLADSPVDIAVMPLAEVIGRRLEQRGALDAATDVAFLTLAELLTSAAGLAEPLRPLVAHRKAEHEANERLVPPAVIGPVVE